MLRSLRVRRTFSAIAILCVLAYPALRIIAGAETTYTPEQIKHGGYLVTIGGCHDCHSPKMPGGMEPDPSRILSGHPASENIPPPPADALSPTGWIAACNAHLSAWAGPWGITFAANLTPDLKTGIGQWTEEQFVKALRTGKHRGFGRPIMPPMPWQNLALATDDDLRAMYAYLMSIPPVNNQVPDMIPPKTK